jgi:23S rRNA (uracil1939-C5)-methyltransferase
MKTKTIDQSIDNIDNIDKRVNNIDKRVLKIVGLGSNGDGYAIESAQKVFVPFTVPGDLVEAVAPGTPVTASNHTARNKTAIRKKESPHQPHPNKPHPNKAHSSKPDYRLLQQSPERATPLCRHFMDCGACQLQHLSPTLYREFKKAAVTSPLWAHQVSPNNVDEPIIFGPRQRRRVVLKAQRTTTGLALGYYRAQSHHIVAIDECPLVVPEIEALITPLRLFLTTFLLPLQKADIAILATITGLDVWLKLEPSFSLNLEQREHLVHFAYTHNLAQLGIGQEVIVTFRTPYIAFAKNRVEAHANGFLQASTAADHLFETLIDLFISGIGVCDLSGTSGSSFSEMEGSGLSKISRISRMSDMSGIPDMSGISGISGMSDSSISDLSGISGFSSGPSLRVADLFCGRGTFSFPLAKYGHVEAYDNDSNALSALTKATKTTPHFHLKAHYRNLFREPLNPQELENFDLVVLNPPRAGAIAQIKQLAQTQVPWIVYVSCNPQSFARDAALLTAKGSYALEKVTPIDQFHWSVHTELFAIFSQTLTKSTGHQVIHHSRTNNDK